LWVNGALESFLMAKKPSYEELEQRVQALEKEAAELKRRMSCKQFQEDPKPLDEEAKLKHADLEEIFKAIPDAVIFADLNRNITKINPGFTGLFGYQPEEIYGKKTELLYTHEQKFKEQGQIRYNPDAREMYQPYEIDYRKKSGEVFHSETIGTPVINKDGKAIGLLAIVRDITKKKQAEETLRQSRDLLQQISDNLPIMFSYVGNDKRYVYANQQFQDSFGQGNIIGKTMKEVLRPEMYEKIQSEVNAVLSGKEVRYERIGLIGEQDDHRYFQVSYWPDKDESGKVTGYFTLINEITELKKAEATRKKIEAQLRQAQKMEAIGTLAGGIAHDFNNILGAIVGYADLATRNISEGDPISYYLEQILQAGYRARDLVKQILLFSRKQGYEQKPLKVNPLMKEAAKFLRASIPAIIEIETDISAASDTIMADSVQIHQVIMNLCTNAAHAMRHQGGILRMSVADIDLNSHSPERIPELKEGPYLRLQFSDTGQGIRHDMLDNIFDPFFTTKERGEGTGLGLAVVHGIVKSHGGAITVQSDPGKGTTFDIYLPRIEIDSGKERKKTPTPIPRGKERVLFVDDEPALVNLGKETLDALGYTVITKTSSLEALEAFRLKPGEFDIVITDLSMPKMTGVELTKKIMRIRSNIPVILCTGFSEQISPEQAASIGIKRLLHKPLIARDMAEAIKKALH